VVFPTPAGYRGDGVFDNIWKLIERWRVTFLVGVPTAIAAMMQRPVNADVSSLEYTFSGSAPLPVELFNRYQNATGVKILEGYGMSEATCLISGNPPIGERKIGSVGMPFPYTDVRICMCNDDGSVLKDCEVNEIGEICVYNPGVNIGETYVEQAKNIGLFVDEKYMRTGDLGRLDENGYLWITGRAKDLIIRGGHNIDPAIIEEALAAHPDVAMAGAIGQPDASMLNWSMEHKHQWMRLWNTRSRTSKNALLCQSTSRFWTNFPKPPSAKSSNPTCAKWPSPEPMTQRSPRLASTPTSPA
jgi:acyl-CoA synthetase (AMP-forming)/AMP-acid ligase II